MVKVKRECVLIKPEDISPSSKNMNVIGVFNPGVIRAQNEDIIMYIRVMEKLIKSEDNKYFYSPRFNGKQKFKLEIDKFDRELIAHSSDLDFVFKDGTKRLKFISHLRRVVLDPSGFEIKSIEQKPSFYGIDSEGEYGIEDPRITKIGKS